MTFFLLKYKSRRKGKRLVVVFKYHVFTTSRMLPRTEEVNPMIYCIFINTVSLFFSIFVDAVNSILLCHRMCKVTKESSGANKITRNAVNFTSITLRWTSSSSRQSVFSTTSDRSQRSPNGGKSLRSIYLVKIGPIHIAHNLHKLPSCVFCGLNFRECATLNAFHEEIFKLHFFN